MARRLFTVKNLIRAALTAFSMANIGVAHAQVMNHADTAIASFVAASPDR